MTLSRKFYNLYLMLVIRLKRVGRKNDPSFRLVVTDKRRAAKAGRSVELLGSYNSRQKISSFKEDRIKYWLSVGAKPSATAHNLFVSKNIISGSKINVSAKSKKKEVAAPMPAEGDVGAPTSAKPSVGVEEKAAA